MTEHDRILDAFRNCITEPKCKDCPWTECEELDNRKIAIPADLALAVMCELVAQEPRVMTLEEVLALKFDDVVYMELHPTGAVISSIVIDVIPKLPVIGIGVIQFRHGGGYNGIDNADIGYYRKTWRCWTSRPTDEQREAEPWQNLAK